MFFVLMTLIAVNNIENKLSAIIAPTFKLMVKFGKADIKVKIIRIITPALALTLDRFNII